MDSITKTKKFKPNTRVILKNLNLKGSISGIASEFFGVCIYIVILDELFQQTNFGQAKAVLATPDLLEEV